MENDPWLDKWIPLIQKKSTNGVVLELGCGSGWDTAELLVAGCAVIATDMSMENLSSCRLTVSKATHVQLNHSVFLPFVDHNVSVILASLTLHYFTWTVTMQIASELRRCLKAGGMLLVRLNSTNDVNYGASTTAPPIEPNFYFHRTMTKRFFDEPAVRSFLQGWDIQFIEENIIYRFEKPKSIWEVMATSKSS